MTARTASAEDVSRRPSKAARGRRNANEYSLVLSAGVGNPFPAPEPGTLVLAELGAVVTILLHGRGRALARRNSVLG